MRGASALQDALDDHPGAKARVLVVWEPVILTDLGPPHSALLSEVSDERALQFWDPELALSAELSRAAEADSTGKLAAAAREIGTCFWDYIAFFPPGVRWGSPAPSPGSWYYPVVEHITAVRADLAALGTPEQHDAITTGGEHGKIPN